MPWYIYALLSAITAAGVTIFAKAGVHSLDTTVATTLRTIIMALLMIGLVFILHKAGTVQISHLKGKEVWWLVLSAVAGALSLLFYFAALKNGPAGKVAVIDRLSLVFIAFLSASFFGEHLTPKSLLGIAFVVCGAILVSWK